jgi:hypothetical protein
LFVTCASQFRCCWLGWTLKFTVVEWRYRRIHRHLSETHVQQCLSLKSKYHDATADENGNMVTPMICGVVAAESLVAAHGVRTRGSAHRICCIVGSLATCQHRIGQELAARKTVVNGAPGILTVTLDICDSVLFAATSAISIFVCRHL